MKQARGASNLPEEHNMKSFNVMATNLNTGTETLVATCVKASDAALLAYNHNEKNDFDPTDTYVVRRVTK